MIFITAMKRRLANFTLTNLRWQFCNLRIRQTLRNDGQSDSDAGDDVALKMVQPAVKSTNLTV